MKQSRRIQAMFMNHEHPLPAQFASRNATFSSVAWTVGLSCSIFREIRHMSFVSFRLYGFAV